MCLPRMLRSCVAISLSLWLVACAGHSERQELPRDYERWAFTETRTMPMPERVYPELEDGYPGDELELGDTRWGESSTFRVTKRYFAASGRACLQGDITHSEGAEDVIVCRQDSNDWVASRAIARALNQPPGEERRRSALDTKQGRDW